MLVAVVLDSGLNPVFIRGLGPAPRLGIAGSATATSSPTTRRCSRSLPYLPARTCRCASKAASWRFLLPNGAIVKTIVVKGLPMGIQMIVISVSALALIGLVNAHGVDTAAAFGVAMQLWTYVQMPAMALGAAVSAMVAQNIGAGRWERVGSVTRSGIIYSVAHHRGAGRATDNRRPLGHGVVHGRKQPGASDRAAHPRDRNLELHPVRDHHGAVRYRPRQRRRLGAPHHSYDRPASSALRVHFRGTDHWLGSDAIWWSFPVSSFANVALAIGYYLQGSWKKARMTVGKPCPDEEETTEEALATREAGGALNPAG